MNRRTFIQASTFLMFSASSYTQESQNDQFIFGHADFKYKLVKNWGIPKDPKKVPVRDCHEMVMDSKKRLLLLGNHIKNNMIIYSKDGNILDTWTHNWPEAHGLTLANENGEEFLFITDFKLGKVFKTTLDGKILMDIDFPKDSSEYSKQTQYRPTEVAVNPKNGDFYVADGYGSQYIIHYDLKGNIKNVFGGKGGESHKFKNAHGICFDNRDKTQPTLLITCRHTFKFKRFSLDGKYIEEIPVPGASISRPVIDGDHLYTAVLVGNNQWRKSNGHIAILDSAGKVVSAPGAEEPRYINGKCENLKQEAKAKGIFMRPHDVCVDDEKNIYIPQFNSKQTYPLKLERI